MDCEALSCTAVRPRSSATAWCSVSKRSVAAPPLFILSLKAGGVGLNLTAANHVFHFDRWWNPAVENQATDRAFRIGQRKNVQVHKFVCVGTLEERIDLMIEQKKELAESIVGSGENWLTEMSTAQLKGIVCAEPRGRRRNKRGADEYDTKTTTSSTTKTMSLMTTKTSTRVSDYHGLELLPPEQPIRVKDGLKTRSDRGSIGSTWWSKRWLAVLESFGMGARLTRGRSYARQGQVVSLDVEPGIVNAKVQGSQPRPYKVKIQLKSLSDQEWEQVLDAMASQAIFAAKLLAGEMPTDIEDAFRAVNLSLFPTKVSDLVTDCTCPDWANPCKHIAAVYYLLADRFDEDPFLIFKLRGRTRNRSYRRFARSAPPRCLPGTLRPRPAKTLTRWKTRSCLKTT